jgi:serine/threonine-protein kinase
MDDLPYVAMEFLEGDTLESLLSNQKALDTDVAFDVATQMLSALAYAHGLGVVHRDLKPDNVFVSQPSGERERTDRVSLRLVGQSRVVKLLDYGLAKFLSPEADPVKGALTMMGMVMGTPLYMAPEQAAGRAIDARVDVYAAGCVLFEMLSGQPPYLGESNGEILRQHMGAPIPRLSDFRKDVVVLPALEEFFGRALAKRAEQRFADAGKMLEALNALPKPALRRLSDVPLQLRAANSVSPDGEPEPRRSASERWQLMALVVTGVVTALALAYALLH